MCLVERFSFCLSNMPEVVSKAAEDIYDNIYQIPTQIHLLAKNFVSDMTKLIKSTEGFDNLARFTADSITFTDLIKRSEVVARPIIDGCTHIRSFISTTRVFSSLRYVISGDLYQDIRTGNVLPVISQVAFIFGRTMNVTIWCMKNKIINYDVLGAIANKIGTLPGGSLLSKITRGQVLDAAFFVALAPLTVTHFKNIVEGRDIIYNALELASLGADLLICTVGVFAYANLYLTATLSLIAAGTAVIAFFCNPSNSSWKDPFAKP